MNSAEVNRALANTSFRLYETCRLEQRDDMTKIGYTFGTHNFPHPPKDNRADSMAGLAIPMDYSLGGTFAPQNLLLQRQRARPADRFSVKDRQWQKVMFLACGESMQKVNYRYDLPDPLLSPKGIDQASRLPGHGELMGYDLIVVSPLRRAVQTVLVAFGERPQCRVVLSPLHAERVKHRCDEGISKSGLAATFPCVASWEGFEELPEVWTPSVGSDEDWIVKRVAPFLAWLRKQKSSRKVLVVGHSAFLYPICGRMLTDCEVQEAEIGERFPIEMPVVVRR